MQIRRSIGNKDDFTRIEKVLNEVRLSSLGLKEHISNFFIAEEEINGNTIGTIGLEIYDSFAILRSIAVIPQMQGRGIGVKLWKVMKQYIELNQKEIKSLLLLTETASEFFKKLGFQVVDRDLYEQVFSKSKIISDHCPQSSIAMKLDV